MVAGSRCWSRWKVSVRQAPARCARSAAAGEVQQSSRGKQDTEALAVRVLVCACKEAELLGEVVEERLKSATKGSGRGRGWAVREGRKELVAEVEGS